MEEGEIEYESRLAGEREREREVQKMEKVDDDFEEDTSVAQEMPPF